MVPLAIPPEADGECARRWFTLAVTSKGFVTEQDRDAAFLEMRKRLENRTCFDCAAANPAWVSLSFGIFLCLNCSGKHRRLGSHLSFVRSTEMDNFTPLQLLRMDLGGNLKARPFFKLRGHDGKRNIEYTSKLASQYRQQLKRAVEGSLKNAGINNKDVFEDATSKETALLDSSHSMYQLSATPPIAATTSDEDNIPIISQNTLNDAVLPTPETTEGSFTSSATILGSQSLSGVSQQGLISQGLPGKINNPSGVTMKAKRLNSDFDFDSMQQEIEASAKLGIGLNGSQKQQQSTFALSAKTSSTVQFPSSNQPASAPVKLSRFANAKSISSQQYFSNESNLQNSFKASTLTRLDPSCQSISSEDFYPSNKEQKYESEEKAFMYLREIKETAKNGLSSLAATGLDFWENAKEWLR